MTPKGHTVEQREHHGEGSRRVHFISPASGEVYFEVARFVDLSPDEAYRRHKAHLAERFAAEGVTIGELTSTTLAGRPAQRYAVRWGQTAREMILVRHDRTSYRIIFDPQSPINKQILASLSFVD